jgi:hypothetical protein
MFKQLKSLFSDNKTQPSNHLEDGHDEHISINAYSTLNVLPPFNFAHAKSVTQRSLNDPELETHLQDCIDYVVNRDDQQMTYLRYHLVRHLQRTRHHLSLRLTALALPAFKEWAQRASAVLLMDDGSLRDPQGRVLLDGIGGEDSEARIPWPADALERKARSEIALAQRGIQVNSALPPVISAAEVQWRPAPEVAGRALALVTVAIYAESLRKGQPLSVELLQERLPIAFEHLSPKEKAFLRNSEADAESLEQMSWRYESAALLAWALGLFSLRPFPDRVCDAGKLALTLQNSITAAYLEQRARLRSANELLDMLDLHYRLHWLTREAELGRLEELPLGLEPDVVMERHYALNWLVRFENAQWDKVDTPT